MAAKYSMQIDQGADFEIALMISDANGNPITLVDYSFKSDAVPSLSVKIPAFSFQFEIADQTVNKGTVWMRLSKERSFAVAIKQDTKFLYDVKMVTPFRKEERLFEGDIVLRPGVTR